MTRLEFIHSKGIVYRDVKPNNFVMGTGNKENTIFVVDYGLAKMFIDENKKHVPFEQQNFAGTAHYASLNAHLKRAQSRRDDLESLGYLLVYFLEGQLPWHGLKASSKRDRRKMIGISFLFLFIFISFHFFYFIFILFLFILYLFLFIFILLYFVFIYFIFIFSTYFFLFLNRNLQVEDIYQRIV